MLRLAGTPRRRQCSDSPIEGSTPVLGLVDRGRPRQCSVSSGRLEAGSARSPLVEDDARTPRHLLPRTPGTPDARALLEGTGLGGLPLELWVTLEHAKRRITFWLSPAFESFT